VAHEAIFRRWEKLREWIVSEREFLIWKSGLEADRRAWQTVSDSSKQDALLMGHALAVPVGNSISLATDIESGDAPALCERSVA
jgi:hypothetical protein